MIPQTTGGDFDQLADALQEAESLLEEPITILRFASQPAAPGVFGTPQKPVFTNFPATAVKVSMEQAAKVAAAGQLSAGDIVLEMRDRLNEGNENVGGAQLADRVLYRGMEYRMVQRTEPVELGAGLGPNAQFYLVHLRRTNATADAVGG